ncbi:MAG: hypothetical protein ABFS18_10845 [Thermodesulfobacteriota bacterium]
MSSSKVVTYERVVSGSQIYDDDLGIAPWKIDDADFTVSIDHELIGEVLDNIKAERSLLVLASGDGCRYGNTILIRFDGESLSIDKPIDFAGTCPPFFRIYFQDATGRWSFFEVATINDLPFNLCTSFPVILYQLKKRRCHRINVPDITTAVFRHGGNLHGGCLVKNISASGMLLCTDSIDEKISNRGMVNDIALVLPQDQPSGKVEGEGHVVLPVVSKGRVVRSFVEKKTDLICLGISFSGDSAVMAGLDSFPGKIKKVDHNG